MVEGLDPRRTSESALRALNISMATSTESDSVEAFVLPTVKYSQGSVNDTTWPKCPTVKLLACAAAGGPCQQCFGAHP